MKRENPFLTRGYAAAKLAERDILYRTDAGYVVYDRFFGLWLKRLQ